MPMHNIWHIRKNLPPSHIVCRKKLPKTVTQSLRNRVPSLHQSCFSCYLQKRKKGKRVLLNTPVTHVIFSKLKSIQPLHIAVSSDWVKHRNKKFIMQTELKEWKKTHTNHVFFLNWIGILINQIQSFLLIRKNETEWILVGPNASHVKTCEFTTVWVTSKMLANGLFEAQTSSLSVNAALHWVT